MNQVYIVHDKGETHNRSSYNLVVAVFAELNGPNGAITFVEKRNTAFGFERFFVLEWKLHKGEKETRSIFSRVKGPTENIDR